MKNVLFCLQVFYNTLLAGQHSFREFCLCVNNDGELFEADKLLQK